VDITSPPPLFGVENGAFVDDVTTAAGSSGGAGLRATATPDEGPDIPAICSSENFSIERSNRKKAMAQG